MQGDGALKGREIVAGGLGVQGQQCRRRSLLDWWGKGKRLICPEVWLCRVCGALKGREIVARGWACRASAHQSGLLNKYMGWARVTIFYHTLVQPQTDKTIFWYPTVINNYLLK